MGVTFSQFFPPAPALTEENLPSQKGKVFIVTGGSKGVGFELCKILFEAGGKVYLAGRSREDADLAISLIKTNESTNTGDIVFLPLHLDDLSTIKTAVDIFTAAESRLDVLFNNAGVSNPPKGSLSAQAHELQMSTNCLAPYLFTQLLLPVLTHTASTSDRGSVRVIWTSSIVVDLAIPSGGFDLDQLRNIPDAQTVYANSKLGNWYLASELARQAGDEGVLSITQNPGNLKTQLLRHLPAVLGYVVAPLLYSAKHGAYTELWAGLSPDLTIEDGGKYIVPWGRLHPNPRKDLINAMKSQEEGGSGLGEAFVKLCEQVTKDYR